MADNKQYSTQILEKGIILVSEDVIASIVAQAVAEVEGVAGLDIKSSSDFNGVLSRRTWSRALKIVIDDKNQTSIDCNINIYYGHNVMEVANAAQEAIVNALDATANIKTLSVNVNVCNILRK